MKKKYKKIDIKTKMLVNNIFLWNYKAAFKWRWIEFSDFREYTPSDDAKYIDWLVSAREGKTIMRRYQEERELDILFFVDSSESMQFGFAQKKIETLLEILYLIAFSGIQNWDKVWALLFGGKTNKFINFKKGSIWLFRILEAVERYQWDTFQEELSFDGLNSLPVKNALVFVFTDRMKIDEKSLKLARLKNDIIFINIFDSFENTLEWKKWIFAFWNDKKDMHFDLDNKRKKQKYIDLRNKKRSELKRLLLKNKLSHLEIDEKTDIYREFLTFMKSREL